MRPTEKTGNKKKDDLAIKEWEQTAARFVDTLYGKSGAEVCDALRAAAALSGKYGTWLQSVILQLLCYTLITQPGEEIFSLVDSIYGEKGGRLQYFPAAFLACLIRECGAGAEKAGANIAAWLSEQLFDKTPCVPYHFLASFQLYTVTFPFFTNSGILPASFILSSRLPGIFWTKYSICQMEILGLAFA